MKFKFVSAFLLLCSLNLTSGSATFEDLIHRYMSIASQNNPELNAESKVYLASRSRLHQARANLLPSVELSSRYTRAGGGREFVFDLNPFGIPMLIRENFMREREQETKFTITQPIFTGGGYYYSYQASRYQAESSRYNLKAFEQDLYLDIVKAYTDLLTVSELVKFSESVVERNRESFRTASARVEVGSAITADSLRARAELTMAKVDLTVNKNRLKIAKREFQRILGTVEVAVEFPDEISLPEIEYFEEVSIATAEETGLKSRPELNSIEAAIRSSSLVRDAVRGSFLPSVFVAADYGWQGEEYKLNSENDFWMVSGILKWNIFNGFGDKARLNEGKLRTRELMYRKTALEDGIRMQVRSAAIEYNNALTEWESALENLSAVEENYRIRKILYESGTGTMLELLDSSELFNKATAGEIASRNKVVFMKYKLVWAKGLNLMEY